MPPKKNLKLSLPFRKPKPPIDFFAQNSCKILTGALCLKMREPILSERTDAPPRRRSLTLATPKKSFVRIFGFARVRFFLLKGKQNFSLVFCSERAGGWALRTSLGRLGIPPPNPLLPSRPRFGKRIFWRAYNCFIFFFLFLF